MATAQIELRLATLEAEVSRLKQRLEEPQPHWVDNVYGAFADDADFLEAMRLGREYRESLRFVILNETGLTEKELSNDRTDS